MVSRKVPVPRPSGHSGNGGKTVSRPGVNSDTGNHFYSPFQPPPAVADLEGDISSMDPDAWQILHVADQFWRVKVPTPSALGLLNEIMARRGSTQIQAINMFLTHHMHSDDVTTMLLRMADPDDAFSADGYRELYRLTVTCGTARPFRRCSD